MRAAGGPGAWVRHNLFRTRVDGVITVVVGAVVAWVLYRAGRYVLVSGRWEIVEVNLNLFLVGRYPRDELWRVATTVVVIALTGGLLAGVIARRQAMEAAAEGRTIVVPLARRAGELAARLWASAVLVVVLLAFTKTVGPSLVVVAAIVAAVAGRVGCAALPHRVGRWLWALPFVLPFVLLPMLTEPMGWDAWGGMMLTLLIASVSMLACFPLGVLLALGRRSKLPAIRAICIGFIELFRGVPLVVLVLMSSVALGFFFPPDVLPGAVVRVIVAFTIFTAAYVAEIVRGGLQSVPRGQTEAAQALGLSPVRITALITLPQALRNVIPALVGQFISLFKDTTLVFIIGFLDPLSVAADITAQPGFSGQQLYAETLAFTAALFWVCAFTLSRESQRLERRLGVGTR